MIYNKDQEYTLKVANTNGEVKEIKFTPEKDMSKPEVIMALKSKYKNFFRLVENKTLTEGLTADDIIAKLNALCKEFNPYSNKDRAEAIKAEVKQLLQDAPDDTEMYRVIMETNSGWTSHGSYSDTYASRKKFVKNNGVWTMYDRVKDLDGAVMSILYNEGVLMNKEDADKALDEQSVNNSTSHRDIVNVGTDNWGNPIGKSTNRVEYPNKKEEADGVLTPIPDELKKPSEPEKWTADKYMEYYFRMANTLAGEYKSGDIDYIKERMRNYNLPETEINDKTIKGIINDIAFAYADEKKKRFNLSNKTEALSPVGTYDIEYATPNYTGGGIYVYSGKLTDGNYFMAEDSIFDKDNQAFSIRIVDDNPDDYGEDSWYSKWQEEHMVRDIVETSDEAREFTKQLLLWIIRNEPDGNYDVGDMEAMLEVINGNLNEDYVSYEEPVMRMSKDQWKKYYDDNINKGEYGWADFDSWWHDMTEKDKLIVKESKADDTVLAEGEAKKEALDLFPAIKKHVIDMIKDDRTSYDIIEYIDGQKQAYSIDKAERDELVKFVQDQSTYECMDCGKEFEINQANVVDDYGTPSCPYCGSGDVAGSVYLDESKSIKTESMSREDIMQCYISDITRVAYTYRKKEAQEEINDIIKDLRSDKDLDDVDKAFVIKMVRPTILDRNLKLEESVLCTEAAETDNSVIVISYGRGMRFPDRQTAIRYYTDCVNNTDPNGSENYSYQNILHELIRTQKPVVYDLEDETEYDWWVQKGKPTDDVSKELLQAHLGENQDDEMKSLDEYIDAEIQKMYDDYCRENKGKKLLNFEDWQEENIDSALMNEFEYEFFSNRTKLESEDK